MKKQIAPKLKNTIRVGFGSRLDPLVKEGLRAIARNENKSMSWVVEETIIQFFKIRHCLRKAEKDESNVRKLKKVS